MVSQSDRILLFKTETKKGSCAQKQLPFFISCINYFTDVE